MDAVEPHWVWLALGLALAAAEIVAPGFFLIWLALAAFVTGVAAWLVPLAFPWQVVVFAGLAFAAVLSARRWIGRLPMDPADPLLNDRGGQQVGAVAEVTQALVNGTGRVRLGDGEWLVRGPDAPVGSRVRIVAHDGAVLIVEPLA